MEKRTDNHIVSSLESGQSSLSSAFAGAQDWCMSVITLCLLVAQNELNNQIQESLSNRGPA